MNPLEREQKLLAQLRSEQELTDLRINKIRDQAKLITDLQLKIAALERELEQAKVIIGVYETIVDDIFRKVPKRKG